MRNRTVILLLVLSAIAVSLAAIGLVGCVGSGDIRYAALAEEAADAEGPAEEAADAEGPAEEAADAEEPAEEAADAEEPAEEAADAKIEATMESGEGAVGFPANAVIGVSMRGLGTMAWDYVYEEFIDEFKAAGFNLVCMHANKQVPDQQWQIASMIETGAKVLVVEPVDSTRLGPILEQAKAAGIYVIGFDSLIENTNAVDGVVRLDNNKTGEMQGRALLQGLAELKGDGPYNIEIFAGAPDDPCALELYAGAMDVLQPKIDDGTLIVVSGQVDFTQCAIPDCDNKEAQACIDALLSDFYSGKEIHGALAPNDGIARAIITASERAGQPLPVTSGLGAEDESIAWVLAGRQYCTIYKPEEKFVRRTVDIIKELQVGNGMPPPDATTYNCVIEVGLYELEPLIVTKANAREVFANNPERMAMLDLLEKYPN